MNPGKRTPWKDINVSLREQNRSDVVKRLKSVIL